MSSIIRFEALSGAHDDGPLCYILQIDEFKFLLDCGWDEKFSPNLVEEYRKHLKSIDAVLITHPDLAHLGALPYLVGKCGLNCPIYATVPVFKMGQMFMYDLHLSRSNNEDFDLFSLDDIDTAFEKMNQLKYSQTVSLRDKGQGLQITPLPAGHLIGGTIWRILKEGEEEIIYAVDYNHHKEKHLNGCILDTINKPTIFITDSYNFTNQNQLKRKNREEKLLETIIKTLRNDGNVLICTDTAGRVLEISHTLDHYWKNEKLGLFSYTIALLNNVAISVIEFAKSQVEWMNDKIVQQFENGRNNPFDFKHIKLCRSLNELAKINTPTNNKVVMASTPDLECGFSRDLFLSWCEDPKNTIIFTSRSAKNTLASYLMQQNAIGISELNIDIKKKVNLEGAELEQYFIKKEEEERQKLELDKKSKELESIDIESSSSDENDGEEVSAGLVTAFNNVNASVLNINGSINNPNDKHDVMRLNSTKKRFFKHSKKSYPMFPYKEKLIKWDDYGEIIKGEEYSFANQSTATNLLPTSKLYDEDGNLIIIEETTENSEKKIEIPTKTILERAELRIKAKLLFIDFEGRSDGESIRKILSTIKPKNLILIHGDKNSTMEMKEQCKQSMMSNIKDDRIFVPQIGEIIDATLDTQLYHVKLKDELVSSLVFQKVKDYELAWIDGIIKPKNLENEIEEHKSIQMTNSLDSSNFDLGLVLQPFQKEKSKQHKAIFINEPKLSDLKQKLLEKMIQAEFHGGVLVCNGKIALKKNLAGRIVLEGVACEDYFNVREILYEQYAII